MRIPALTAALSTVLLAMPAQAAPQFVNGLTLNGALLDQSGGTLVNNGRLGYFSDLYYDRASNQWLGLSDRGPGGGTIGYDTRVQRFSLDVNPATGAISNFAVQQTVVFRNGSLAFNGLAPSVASNPIATINHLSRDDPSAWLLYSASAIACLTCRASMRLSPRV